MQLYSRLHLEHHQRGKDLKEAHSSEQDAFLLSFSVNLEQIHISPFKSLQAGVKCGHLNILSRPYHRGSALGIQAGQTIQFRLPWRLQPGNTFAI
nr:hypothetical protein [Synechococcus sp. CBW1107]